MLLGLTVAIDRASLLFAVLSIVANVVAVGVVVVALASRSAGARARLAPARALVGRWGLPAAAAVATTATAGSLWFSEWAGLLPCRFCWYQRCAMYPLAAILLIASIRRDVRIAWYAVPLAVVGLGLSTYHYVLEWFPDLDSGSCDPLAPCTLVYFRRFGYASLPEMAGSGFLAIIALLLAAARWAPSGEPDPTPRTTAP